MNSTIKQSTQKDISDLKKQWDACLKECTGDSVFLTHEWFVNFIQKVDDIGDLFILYDLIGKQGGTIFPGIITKETIHKFDFRSVGFISNYYSPYCSFINFQNREGISDILEHIAGVKHWDIMVLRDIRESNNEYGIYCSVLDRLKIPYALHDKDENWYLPCENSSFEEYLDQKGKKKKKKWLYEKRRMERMDGFAFKMQQNTDDNLKKAVDDYYDVYNNSWKVNEPYPEFHKSLIRIAAEKKWLRLGTIYLGSTPVASQIWLVYGGTASILKVAYNEEFKKYSPGTVLLLYMIQHAIDVDKVSEIDFLKGKDSYKKDWMTECRKLNTLIVYNKKSLKGRLLYLFDRYGYPVQRKIAQFFKRYKFLGQSKK